MFKQGQILIVHAVGYFTLLLLLDVRILSLQTKRFTLQTKMRKHEIAYWQKMCLIINNKYPYKLNVTEIMKRCWVEMIK